MSKPRRRSPRRTRAAPAGRLRLDLPNYLPYRLTTLAALIRRAFAEIYRDDPGLTEPEWKVMTTLAHYGPLPSGEIGLYVTLDRVAVSRAVARLVALGLATRTDNPDDQRTFMVDLTRHASRVYDRMAAEAIAIEERMLAALDEDEILMLLRVVDKIEARFRSPADQRRIQLMRAARLLVDTLSPPSARPPGARKPARQRSRSG